MISAPAIRDQIAFFSSPARLRVPAFRVIDRMQDRTPGEQLLGTAVALVAMSEAIGLPLNDLLTVAHNVMRDVEGPFTYHVQAIRDYAKNEIGRAR